MELGESTSGEVYQEHGTDEREEGHTLPDQSQNTSPQDPMSSSGRLEMQNANSNHGSNDDGLLSGAKSESPRAKPRSKSKVKPVVPRSRRSRRLQGLDPENDGQY
jgi:hypothetical protein